MDGILKDGLILKMLLSIKTKAILMQKHYLDKQTQEKISTGLIPNIKPYEKFSEEENNVELGIRIKREYY